MSKTKKGFLPPPKGSGFLPMATKGFLDEDNQTKRICVSSSVEGCIKAIGCNIFIGCNLYIYKADIDISIIKQPTESEVPDVWITGECWVLKPTMFELFKTLLVKDIKKFMIAPRESLFNVEYQLI